MYSKVGFGSDKRYNQDRVYFMYIYIGVISIAESR